MKRYRLAIAAMLLMSHFLAIVAGFYWGRLEQFRDVRFLGGGDSRGWFEAREPVNYPVYRQFPARVNGIMLDAGSLETTGSPTKSSL